MDKIHIGAFMIPIRLHHKHLKIKFFAFQAGADGIFAPTNGVAAKLAILDAESAQGRLEHAVETQKRSP